MAEVFVLINRLEVPPALGTLHWLEEFYKVIPKVSLTTVTGAVPH